MRAVFAVRVREPVEFVRAALKHFHRDCFLSLEGDLSRFDPALVPGASREPSALLRRNTIWPLLDFVILPVTAATAETICRRVLPQVGLKHHVVHVQVASEGHLVLGARDNFGRDCVWIDQGIGKEGIVSLLDSGVIGWYQAREYEPSQSAPAPIRKSTLAKLSLIFSCCSLLLPFGSIIGIVCGHMAMSGFRRDPALAGKKMAMWGLIIGYTAIPLALLGAYFIFRILGR
jgi:hypothetical protein